MQVEQSHLEEVPWSTKSKMIIFSNQCISNNFRGIIKKHEDFLSSTEHKRENLKTFFFFFFYSITMNYEWSFYDTFILFCVHFWSFKAPFPINCKCMEKKDSRVFHRRKKV